MTRSHRVTRSDLVGLPHGELAERIECAVRYLEIGLPAFAFATLEGRPCYPMPRRIAPPPLAELSYVDSDDGTDDVA